MVATDDFLNEKIRAQDILLGGLGFGEEAIIIDIKKTEAGYKGTGRWPDGEMFEFESNDEPSELEEWALLVMSS